MGFQLLLMRSISIGYSLTNKRKTAIFGGFGLFWAFFGHFFLSSPKWLKIFDSSFEGNYSIHISSVQDYSEPFLMRGSLRINFQLKSIHQFRQCTFRLQQFSINLISSDFAYILNLSFPMALVYTGENRLSLSFFIFGKWGSKHWGTLKKQLYFWAARA